MNATLRAIFGVMSWKSNLYYPNALQVKTDECGKPLNLPNFIIFHNHSCGIPIHSIFYLRQ